MVGDTTIVLIAAISLFLLPSITHMTRTKGGKANLELIKKSADYFAGNTYASLYHAYPSPVLIS